MSQLVWPNGSTAEPSFTSAYGPRTPIWTSEGWTRPYHVGCDWVGINRLMAIGDGLVVQSSYISWAGWQILIHLGRIDGIETWVRYCHLASRSHLNVGDRVKRGELVGFEGSTGQVTGKHLHMEIYRGAVDRGSGAHPGTTTDPRPFILARLTPKPTPTPESEKEDDDMPKNTAMRYTRAADEVVVVLIGNPGSGFELEYRDPSGKTNMSLDNSMAAAFDTGDYINVPEYMAQAFKRSLTWVREAMAGKA